MATTSLSYQRLKHDDTSWPEGGDEYYGKAIRRLRNSRLRRLHVVSRRLRVKIPSLKRFLRRKTRVVKIAFNKVCRRLKESRSHFGDLFAGNYLFVQVTPTPPFKYAHPAPAAKSKFVKAHHLHGLPVN